MIIVIHHLSPSFARHCIRTVVIIIGVYQTIQNTLKLAHMLQESRTIFWGIAPDPRKRKGRMGKKGKGEE
jgi:hypothetical protein